MRGGSYRVKNPIQRQEVVQLLSKNVRGASQLLICETLSLAIEIEIGEEYWIQAFRLGLLSRILKSLIKVGYPSRFKSFLSDF